MTTDHIRTVTITWDIPKNLCEDILITAVEGGINYWAAVGSYKPQHVEAGVHDGYAEVRDDVEPSETWHHINADSIARGIQVLLHEYPETGAAARMIKAVVNYPNGDFDFDAGDADCVLQAAVFGEIIYG